MSDKFKKYNFGKFHPLKPERVLLTWELIKGLRLHEHENCVVAEPVMATDGQIGILHDKDYIEFIKKVTREQQKQKISDKTIVEGLKYNLGPGDNPIFPFMHEGSAIVVGGTMVAINTVFEDNGITKAFNAAGGLHHAMAGQASGFCIYNDPAIGILSLLEKHAGDDLRVMYIDVDAHHGDGVQAAFYDNPNVLTVSIHESGKYLFPGTGFPDEIGVDAGEGYSINVPLPPFTFDDTYLDILDELLPDLVKAFSPDLIVSQNGVDTHCLDPLTNLGLTTRGHKGIFQRINDLSDKHCHGKLVAIGGGGYNLSVVPRSWTMLFAELLGVLDELPEEIPRDLLESLNVTAANEPIPKLFIDPTDCKEIKTRRTSYKFLEAQELYVQEISFKIKQDILPLIQGRK